MNFTREDKIRKRKTLSFRFLLGITFLGQMIMGIVGLAVPIYAVFLGAPPLLIGLIGSAGGLVYSFMPLIAGRLSDRYNRKPFILVSLIVYGVSCLLYSLIEMPIMFIAVKALEWLALSTFWPAMEAVIADSTDARLEETLKRFNISWSLAMVIGPVIGGSLVSPNPKIPFQLSLIVAFCSGILGLVMIKETPRRREEPSVELTGDPESHTEERISWRIALSSIVLFSSVDGMIISIFPAYALGLGIPAHEIGLIVFAFGVARVITFFQANNIEGRIGKLGMFLAGSSSLAVASFFTFESYSTLTFMGCFLIFGVGSGVSYAPSLSFMLSKWKMSRGYAAGMFESLIGLGYFVGPLIGGVISECAADAPYIFCSLLSLAVLGFQFILFMRKK